MLATDSDFAELLERLQDQGNRVYLLHWVEGRVKKMMSRFRTQKPSARPGEITGDEQNDVFYLNDLLDAP